MRLAAVAALFAFTFRENEPHHPHRPSKQRLGQELRVDRAHRASWGLEGPPATFPGPAPCYLWHPAVGVWARGPCRQGQAQ